VYSNGRYEGFLADARAAADRVDPSGAQGGAVGSEPGQTEPGQTEPGQTEPGQADQGAAPTDAPELHRGASGDWVLHLQRELRALGIAPLSTLPENQAVDGDFGRRTSLAVRRFQAAMGAQPSGVVDGETWQWIALCRAQQWFADIAEDFGIIDEDEPDEQQAWQRGPTGQQLVELAQQQVGDRYQISQEVDLEDEDPEAFDCSELIQWACHQLGVDFPDGSANQIGAVAAAGLECSVAEASGVAGALLYRPPGGGRQYGHVALSLGTGNETVEATGRDYGVCESEIGSRFVRAGYIPGVDYSDGS
jgi:peptidoglycan hydrolase-like protein with peptidoglycan-binding domain